jgi:hypothetical protein
MVKGCSEIVFSVTQFSASMIFVFNSILINYKSFEYSICLKKNKFWRKLKSGGRQVKNYEQKKKLGNPSQAHTTSPKSRSIASLIGTVRQLGLDASC